VITSELLEAYLACPMKCYLQSNGEKCSENRFAALHRLNPNHCWDWRPGKIDHDDIRFFAEAEVANNPELRNCSCFGGSMSRGGCCGISLVGC
jgi:hypothetical protein